MKLYYQLFLLKILNLKIIIRENRDSQAPVGCRRFQIGCVFVVYDLVITKNLKQNFTYIRFGIIWTQF